MTSTTLVELAGMLADAGASPSASECHGILCGALCVHDVYSAESWLRDVSPEQTPDAAPGPFASLVSETMADLRGDQMRFGLLLPDDSVPIAERAESLGSWCEGFLYGLTTSGNIQQVKLSDDVEEILRDFAEISRAAPDDGDSDEENEAAYAELVEFVRVGAQLVHDELESLRGIRRGG